MYMVGLLFGLDYSVEVVFGLMMLVVMFVVVYVVGFYLVWMGVDDSGGF